MWHSIYFQGRDIRDNPFRSKHNAVRACYILSTSYPMSMNCTGALQLDGDIAGTGVRVSFYVQNFLLGLYVQQSAITDYSTYCCSVVDEQIT